MHSFQEKDPGETLTLTFDFSAEIGNESISSQVVAISVLTGEDASAAAMLNGAAASSGNSVLQSVKNGVANVDYRLTCTIQTATRTLVLAGTLPVRVAS